MITENQRDSIDKDVSEEELYEALKSCKDTTPGIDGIGYEFYKSFWSLWKNLIYNSWQHSLAVGFLPEGNRMSLITLLPKDGKDLAKIGNWRPISLSNCDLKIITKLYAIRLSKISGDFIYRNQTAYVPGRSIMDNLRVIKHAAEELESNVELAIVSLDAKKAFDSVNHKFIRITLEKYGFGQNFIRVFEVLYTDLKANVLVNGWKSELIKISNGVKQGDALSCIIFILCIDPLLRNIEENKTITSAFQHDHSKIFGFADDINAITSNNLIAIQGIFDEYEVLTRLCGLELNADKTETLIIKKKANVGQHLQQPAMQAPLQLAPMGRTTTTPYGGTNSPDSQENIEEISINYMGKVYKINPRKNIKICGIVIGQDAQVNVSRVITNLKKQLDMWRMRSLTILGKILILKTFGISQLIYVMQCCGFTDEDHKKIDDIILDFIWKKSTHKKRVERISRIIMMKPTICGGFGLPKARELDESMKIKQYLRSRESIHIISVLQNTWLEDPRPYTRINNNEPIIVSTIRAITEHANKWLIRSEELDERVPWLGNLSIKSLEQMVNITGIPKLFLKRRCAQGSLSIKDAIEEIKNGNHDTEIILKPFKDKFKNIYNNLLTRTAPDCSFKLTDKIQVIELNNKITTKVIRMCLMSLKYNCLDHITLQKSYMIPDIKNKHVITMLSNVSLLTCTRNKNTMLRMLNGEWYTNLKLKKMGLKESPICDRCNLIEDREHMLVECKYVHKIWKQFYQYTNVVLGTNLEVNIENVLCIGNNAASKSIIALTAELINLICSRKRPLLNEASVLTVLKRTVNNELHNNNRKNKRIWEKWQKFLHDQDRTMG
jgi:hypothetical protein